MIIMSHNVHWVENYIHDKTKYALVFEINELLLDKGMDVQNRTYMILQRIIWFSVAHPID